ncbi:DNA-binding protein [Salmonella enterica]|nr:DNA-binding protein [Salmonella enterica]
MAITEKQIMQAADELAREGLNPTLARVRKKLGGGSFTTISEVMIEWRTQKVRSASPHEPVPPAITDRLTAFGEDIWALAREIACTAFTGERKTLEKSRQETEVARAEATTLADQLASELEESRSLIRTLQEKLAIAAKETEAVAHERNKAQSETTELREQIASLRGELQAVTLCHQKIVDAIKQNKSPAQ